MFRTPLGACQHALKPVAVNIQGYICGSGICAVLAE